MTEERLPLAELLAQAGDGDFLRSMAEAVVQLLMETDVDGLIGAGRYERSGERASYRNGDRERALDTRLGSLQLRIPKLRQESYFPPFLEGGAPDLGEGAGSGNSGSLDRRRLDPPGGRSGSSHGAYGDQQEHGIEALQGH